MRLFDLQVNGYLGVDFSSDTLNAQAFRDVAHALIDHGVTRFLPTLITGFEVCYKRNLALLSDVLDRDDELRAHIPGFHLEGPFISPEPGAVGAHPAAAVHLPDCAYFDRLNAYANGRIKLLTLAAERPGAVELVRHVRATGCAVSCGHQLATAADLARCADAGAQALTHFGNGIPNTIHRHNNPLVAGLCERRLSILFIPDGHHLPIDFLTMLARIIPASQLIATSDASPAAGLPPGRYHVLGNDAILEPDGKLHNPEKQCLVGSSATLVECAAVLQSLGCFSPAEVEQLCWSNPCRLIGLDAAAHGFAAE